MKVLSLSLIYLRVFYEVMDVSEMCGLHVPRSQHFLGRRWIGEGAGCVQTYPLSKLFALVYLEHALLEVFHFPLMKRRGIKFLG